MQLILVGIACVYIEKINSISLFWEVKTVGHSEPQNQIMLTF
jgi:hypothetical protein